MEKNQKIDYSFTAVPDELLEMMVKIYLSDNERRVLGWIIRKTFGWNKKEDWISNSQFEEATGIKDTHICKVKKKLLKKNIIKVSYKKKEDSSIYKRKDPYYSINLNYKKWKPEEKI
jgi:phage replication O-like protein O